MANQVKASAVVTEQDQILVAEVQRQMQNCYLFWAARHPGLPRVPAIQAIGRCFLLGSRRYGDKNKYSLDQTSVMTMGMIERKELEKFIPKHN